MQDKWAIAQSIETTTTNAGWSVGSTRSVQVTAGFEFLGEGVQVGLTASFSFAYNFQNSTATAQASQNTFTEGLQVSDDSPACFAKRKAPQAPCCMRHAP